MTFKEAVNYRNKLGYVNFTAGGLDFEVFVTPADPQDFLQYLTVVRGYFYQLTDDDAIHFSKRGTFKVCGLYFDGANIVHKTL